MKLFLIFLLCSLCHAQDTGQLCEDGADTVVSVARSYFQDISEDLTALNLLNKVLTPRRVQDIKLGAKMNAIQHLVILMVDDKNTVRELVFSSWEYKGNFSIAPYKNALSMLIEGMLHEKSDIKKLKNCRFRLFLKVRNKQYAKFLVLSNRWRPKSKKKFDLSKLHQIDRSKVIEQKELHGKIVFQAKLLIKTSRFKNVQVSKAGKSHKNK